MFDGMVGPPGPRRTSLPRSALPVLRAMGSEATVTGLAVMLAGEAIEAARWTAVTWPGQDTAVPGHPSRAACYDPITPPGRAAETAGLLADAIVRHQAFTGADGLVLARRAISDFLGERCPDLVNAILAPLETARVELEIETLLAMPEAGDPPQSPPPQPTSAERRDLARALLDYGCEDARLHGLVEALDAFGAAHCADDGLGPSTGTRAALAVVQTILQAAARGGIEPGFLKTAVVAWAAAAVGRPDIDVNIIG